MTFQDDYEKGKKKIEGGMDEVVSHLATPPAPGGWIARNSGMVLWIAVAVVMALGAWVIHKLS